MPSDRGERDAWVKRVLHIDLGASPQHAAKPEASAVSQRLERLEPAYLKAVRGDGPDRTRLSALMSLAHELLEEGATERADKTLAQIEALIAKPGAEDRKPSLPLAKEPLYDTLGSPGRLVAYRKALLAWNAAKAQSRSQLGQLQKSIASTAPTLAQAAGILEQVMTRLEGDLSDAIDAALNAEDMGMRARANATAAEMARSYLMTVNFDPVFRAVDTNPVMPLSLRETLGTALTQVVAAMPA